MFVFLLYGVAGNGVLYGVCPGGGVSRGDQNLLKLNKVNVIYVI